MNKHWGPMKGHIAILGKLYCKMQCSVIFITRTCFKIGVSTWIETTNRNLLIIIEILEFAIIKIPNCWCQIGHYFGKKTFWFSVVTYIPPLKLMVPLFTEILQLQLWCLHLQLYWRDSSTFGHAINATRILYTKLGSCSCREWFNFWTILLPKVSNDLRSLILNDWFVKCASRDSNDIDYTANINNTDTRRYSMFVTGLISK